MSVGTPNATTPQPPPNSISVNNLGYHVDGWADLIEGMGEKSDEVREKVLASLNDREMPGVFTKEMTGIVSLVSSERRTHIINTTSPGATTTVYVGNHGKDLYVAWRTYVRPILNTQTLLVALGIAAFLGLLIGGIDESSSSFFGPSRTTFSMTGWITYTIGFAILAAIVLYSAGRFFKGNALAYFFVEGTIFDTDDILAMSFSAHKSLLRALDTTGIDISKLRIKQTFKGGRRGVDF
jgi:hypothetical protein